MDYSHQRRYHTYSTCFGCFLILSGQNKSVCNQNLTTFLKICNTVGVPIKQENTVYAQKTMTFIGIELDTIAIDNVLKIKNSLKLE